MTFGAQYASPAAQWGAVEYAFFTTGSTTITVNMLCAIEFIGRIKSDAVIDQEAISKGIFNTPFKTELLTGAAADNLLNFDWYLRLILPSPDRRNFKVEYVRRNFDVHTRKLW